MAKTNNDNPAGDSSAALPSAGVEPEAQVASTMATEPGGAGTAGHTRADGAADDSGNADSSALARSDYAMPDDYETDWVGQTKQWVEDNPVLAVVAAAGIGLLIGRLVVGAVSDPDPSFAQRVEKRAKKLRKEAKHHAADAGGALSAQLKKAARALSDAADTASDTVSSRAEAGYDKTMDLAEVVGDAVKAAVTGVVAKKADGWISRLRR